MHTVLEQVPERLQAIPTRIELDESIQKAKAALLNDVYGVSGFYSSLPAVIGANGVEKVFVPELSDSEIEAWRKSCKRNYCRYRNNHSCCSCFC